MSDETVTPNETPTALVQLQFDYTWKWFCYHADQRTKMFNFMLIAVGALATAAVGAYNQNLLSLAIVLCGLSALFAFSFSRLDLRNEELVRLGEEVLAHLERTAIFGQNVKMPLRDKTKPPVTMGLLSRQVDVDEGKEAFYAPSPFTFADAGRGKHRVWLRGLAYVIVAVFVVAGALIAYQRITDP